MGVDGSTQGEPAARLTHRTISTPVAQLVVGFLGITAALAGYSLASGRQRYATAGNSYPGTLVNVAEPVGYFTASVVGALCLGALAYLVVMSRPQPDGLLDVAAFRIHLAAERLSIAWVITSTAMVGIQAAHDSGVGLTKLLSAGPLVDCIATSEISRGWLATAICALLVAVTLRFITRWTGHCVLLIPTAIGVLATAVTGNAGQGPAHDYSTSTVIVLAIAVAMLTGLTATTAWTGTTPSGAVLVIQVVCGGLALSYGAMLLHLLSAGSIVSSSFGHLGLIAGVLLALVWIADCWRLLANSPQSHRHAQISALAMMVVMAATAAMAVQTAPRFLTHLFTNWDVFLGYALPQPPGIVTLLTVWRFDTVVGAVAVVLAVSYLIGYVRLRRRGNSWPIGRLVSWLTGCGALLYASSSGVRAYGSAMFSVHMAEHMSMNMFIPVLLVLGGPVTLALRALPATSDQQRPGPREWLTWLLHSPVTAFLSHPITAFVFFVASPYIVYFTPLFNTLARYHWGHEFMAIHFLLTGYLFYWAIIGIDPGPRRLPYPARIGLLFAVMPFHAFFGIALMTMNSAVGGTFYQSVHLPWLASIEADQHLGGAIAWTATEFPVIIVIVALAVQWARQDRKVATRTDRHADSDYADDELDAYNAMLQELARIRR
ncbi:MAG: cytochrome c oxidase assembly protein [Mycobacteriaceae bacterium]|nr:cytochrome c oxidase assembly protein [Mycobacteriaceae bacterium]